MTDCTRESFHATQRFLLSIGALVFLYAFAPHARAESPEIASIRSEISNNNHQASKLHEEIRALILQKVRSLAEMRSGAFCSDCNRTKSEIEAQEHVSFASHIQEGADGGRHVVPATQEQLDEKAAEFDEKIKALQGQLNELGLANSRLNSRAMQIQYQERQAAMQTQIAEQREKAEANQRALKEQFDQIAENIRNAQKRLEEKREQASQEQSAKQQEEINRLKDQQQRLVANAAKQQAFFEAAANQRPATPEPLEEYKGGPSNENGPPAMPPLTAEQKAQQSRLQELADAGLVVGPPSFNVDGIKVTADKGVSLWNRVMNFKSDVEDVGRAAERVAANETLDFQSRVKLIKENAFDQVKLTDNVLGQLSPAADALATGNTQGQADVQNKLDQSASSFASSANERAARASPAYDLMNSAERLRGTTNDLTKPLETYSNDQERADAYKSAGKSMWDAAMNARPDAPANATPTNYGPKNANGSGPLGDKSSTYFQGGTYAAKRQAEPVELYRVQKKSGGEVVTYWSTKPQSDFGTGGEIVKIKLPPNQEYYEGASHDANDGSLIVIKGFNSDWIVK